MWTLISSKMEYRRFPNASPGMLTSKRLFTRSHCANALGARGRGSGNRKWVRLHKTNQPTTGDLCGLNRVTEVAREFIVRR